VSVSSDIRPLNIAASIDLEYLVRVASEAVYIIPPTFKEMTDGKAELAADFFKTFMILRF
jgi:hypothetical protein